MNIVTVQIVTESGCNPREGEYALKLAQIIGALDIYSDNGSGDISLIRECAFEYICDNELPAEALIELVMREESARDDVFISRWYEVETAAVIKR